ncbi:hypothetical protein FKP32DRAFT_1190408 [Trametes sanguinea]|nr:hypothetical protein FKP32DRAFT_1190408 [Trametes sanguinea]
MRALVHRLPWFMLSSLSSSASKSSISVLSMAMQLSRHVSWPIVMISFWSLFPSVHIYRPPIPIVILSDISGRRNNSSGTARSGAASTVTSRRSATQRAHAITSERRAGAVQTGGLSSRTPSCELE